MNDTQHTYSDNLQITEYYSYSKFKKNTFITGIVEDLGGIYSEYEDCTSTINLRGINKGIKMDINIDFIAHATSYKDAVDCVHKAKNDWLNDYFDVMYKYLDIVKSDLLGRK